MAHTPMTVLLRNPSCSDWVRSSEWVTVVQRPDPEVAANARNVFVLALASELSEVAPFVRAANSRHHLRALFVQADLAERWIGQMLSRADLRTLRNLLVHQGPDLPRRVLGAWKMGAQDDLIADAVAVNDRLLVFSCALERIEIPFADVPALARLSKGDRGSFEVASDGSYLHWSGPDIHLDLEAFRIAVDPKVGERARVEQMRHNARFGRAVATMREGQGLRQSDIEGLSARQVRRIEAGEFFPRSGTLGRLARAHGMTLANYLDAVAKTQA